MSRRKDAFLISVDMTEAMKICRDAVASTGWLILDQNETGITIKEPGAINLNQGTWSVTLKIECVHEAGGTMVSMEGKNFGFGPIQSKHVAGQIGRFRNLVELASAKTNTTA